AARDAHARECVERLLLCSGKSAVEIVQSEARVAARDAALVRIEELYPFPDTELARVIASYPNLRELVWVQEEPQNMGAWSYVALRLTELVQGRLPLRYVGRPVRASTAEGSAQ